MICRTAYLPLIVLVVSVGLVAAVSELVPRCLQYSWLGADAEYRTQGMNLSDVAWNADGHLGLSNSSCKDFPKPKPIPCVSPHVVTGGGEVPNATMVWDSFGDTVVCNPGKGNVCALVVFFFSDQVYNLTAYCTRVSVDGNPFTGSCISAKKGAYINKVCVCNPEHEPCNTWIPSPSNAFHNQAVGFLISSLFVVYWVTGKNLHSA